MRVVLTSPLEVVREGLRCYLTTLTPSLEVRTAPGIATALTVSVSDGPFDLILVDDRLIATDGVVALDPILAAMPDTPIAILSHSLSTPMLHDELAQRRISAIPLTYNGTLLISVLKFIAGKEVHISVPEPPAVSENTINGGNEPIFFTDRQQQVLSQLALGFSNKAIARSLFIEEVTVRLHLRGIFRKLGVTNRTQAVTRAVEKGFVTLSDAPPVVGPEPRELAAAYAGATTAKSA